MVSLSGDGGFRADLIIVSMVADMSGEDVAALSPLPRVGEGLFRLITWKLETIAAAAAADACLVNLLGPRIFSKTTLGGW